MFFEVMPLYECFLPLAEKLGVPIIATFSMRTSPRVDNEFGNPVSIAIPGPQSSMPLRSSFFGRIQNALEEIHMHIRTAQIWSPMIEKINQKYFPSYNLRRDQISLLFTNNHASIFSKATARNVIDIPGIHLKPVKPLPQVRYLQLLRKYVASRRKRDGDGGFAKFESRLISYFYIKLSFK